MNYKEWSRIESKLLLAVPLLMALLLGLGLLSVNVAAQSGSTPALLAPGETLVIECAGDQLQLQPQSAQVVIAGCAIIPPPTSTPAATPGTTATPQPVPVAPYVGAPICTDHDPTQYHTLWNEQAGCHYDHEHGRPYPAWAAALWGDYTAYTGQEIGYPWQTLQENELKHPGYNFDGYDFRGETCRPFVTPGGVDAWFVQAHGMANAMGQQARVHSFWGAAHLCNADGPAGTIVTGGHVDFGQLVSPYKTTLVGPDVYPKAPTPYSLHSPPYVGTAKNRFDFETWNSATRGGSAPFVDEHQLFAFAFRIADPVGAWRPDGSFEQLGGNSSARQMYQIEVRIPASLAGPDGLVNFSGWTDVHGNIDPSCSETGPSCVPLQIRDARPGSYSVNAPAAGLFGLRQFYEGDVYINGRSSGWIGPMN